MEGTQTAKLNDSEGERRRVEASSPLHEGSVTTRRRHGQSTRPKYVMRSDVLYSTGSGGEAAFPAFPGAFDGAEAFPAFPGAFGGGAFQTAEEKLKVMGRAAK